MRIAEIVSGHALNGAGVHLAGLTRQLVARGHDVTVMCRPGSWMESVASTMTEVVGSDLHRWPLDELQRIARLVEERNIDVIHTHMSRAHLFGVLLKRFVDIPVVATAHNRRIQPHWMFNDHVIAVSEAVARFQHRWNLVRRDRLTVVHNFVEPAAFDVPPAVRSRVRASLGVGTSTFLIGVIGSVFVEKGVHHMIEALPAVRARVADSMVVVGGRGPESYRRTLLTRAEALGVSSQIIWTGAFEDAGELLAALDVVVVPVLPSPADAFVLVCLEGMAAALPVIASRAGGIPEVIADGETGLLVPPGSPQALAEAIAAIACDRDRGMRLGAAGRRRAATLFSAERQVARTEEVLRNVAAGGARACLVGSRGRTAPRS